MHTLIGMEMDIISLGGDTYDFQELLLNNFNVAIIRYKNLRKRLKTNKELEKQYVDAMNISVENNEMEEVDESEIKASDPTRILYYIPYLPVVREDKV